MEYTPAVNEPPVPLREVAGFDWDTGNSEKSWERHRVSRAECEEVFDQRPLLLSEDLAHSAREKRHLALGRTRSGRHLLVAFTLRGPLVRVISARDMNRKERGIYGAARIEEELPADSDVS